jgi:hypothetical protein
VDVPHWLSLRRRLCQNTANLNFLVQRTKIGAPFALRQGMHAPAPSPVPPWHKRVLGWLGMDAGTAAAESEPDIEQRFPWEPMQPAPRPPQWGAADQPELLLGSDEPV